MFIQVDDNAINFKLVKCIGGIHKYENNEKVSYFEIHTHQGGNYMVVGETTEVIEKRKKLLSFLNKGETLKEV